LSLIFVLGIGVQSIISIYFKYDVDYE